MLPTGPWTLTSSSNGLNQILKIGRSNLYCGALFPRVRPTPLSPLLTVVSTVIGIRHSFWSCATSSPDQGYSIDEPQFIHYGARQESAMRLQESPASQVNQRIPTISATPRSFLAVILSFACVLSLGIELPASAANPASAKDKKPKNDPALKGLPITELSPDEAILHALNRLAYGPRPGEVERIRQMGLAKWVEQQLNPNSIDDRALDARLADYPTLRMSTAKLIDEYPQPKPAEKQAEKRAQAQAQQEQRRSDAAAEKVARDVQGTQGPVAGGGDGEAVQQNTANAKQEMSDAPALMKQEQPEGNPATKGVGKRDVLGGADPNNVPRAIADDSKRPQRVVAELGMPR